MTSLFLFQGGQTQGKGEAVVGELGGPPRETDEQRPLESQGC
jgi:hypothetical protein